MIKVFGKFLQYFRFNSVCVYYTFNEMTQKKYTYNNRLTALLLYSRSCKSVKPKYTHPLKTNRFNQMSFRFCCDHFSKLNFKNSIRKNVIDQRGENQDI